MLLLSCWSLDDWLLTAGGLNRLLLVVAGLYCVRSAKINFRSCGKSSNSKPLRSPPSPDCLLLLLLVLLRSCCLIAKLTIADCWNELLLAVEIAD